MPEGPLGFIPRFSNIGPLSRETEEELREYWEPCPTDEKRMRICEEIKIASIEILEDQEFFPDYQTLPDINSGQCYSIVDHVTNHLDYVNVLRVGDGDHFWIEYEGMHYDAEKPSGVPEYEMLPFFYRIPHDPLIDHAIWADLDRVPDNPRKLEDVVVDVTEDFYV